MKNSVFLYWPHILRFCLLFPLILVNQESQLHSNRRAKGSLSQKQDLSWLTAGWPSLETSGNLRVSLASILRISKNHFTNNMNCKAPCKFQVPFLLFHYLSNCPLSLKITRISKFQVPVSVRNKNGYIYFSEISIWELKGKMNRFV